MVRAEVTAFQCARVRWRVRVHKGSWWTGGFNALWPRSSWAVMCVQCCCGVALWMCTCRATVCADVKWCPLVLRKYANARQTLQNSGEQLRLWGGDGALPAPSLSHCCPPPGCAATPIKTHLISLPSPSLLYLPPFPPVHHSFLFTVGGFVPCRLDTCDSSVTHHTALQYVCWGGGQAQLGSELKAC